MGAHVNQFSNNTADASSIGGNRLTALLRGLGALAIVGSGLVYMVQGLYDASLDLRSWVYLTLICALGLGGIFSHKLMQDNKGARVFFALGTLLVPVQFSQLGGMALNYFAGEHNFIALFKIAAPSTAILLSVGALSVLLGLLMSYAGFAVLSRPWAKTLCATFMLMNLTLLVPSRTAVMSLILIAALGGIFLQLDRRIFQRDLLFATSEGLTVRLIALLPLAIASTRAAFHYSEFLGVCLLFACASVVCLYTAESRQDSDTTPAQHWAREFLLFCAFATGLFALPGMSYELFGQYQGYRLASSPLAHITYSLPVFLLSLYVSSKAWTGAPLYSTAAIIALATTGAVTASAGEPVANLILIGMSVYLAARGFYQREKVPFAAGSLLALAALIDLIVSALQNVSVNLWLLLAVGGLSLMALSSVLEKHGRRWVQDAGEYWQEFNRW